MDSISAAKGRAKRVSPCFSWQLPRSVNPSTNGKVLGPYPDIILIAHAVLNKFTKRWRQVIEKMHLITSPKLGVARFTDQVDPSSLPLKTDMSNMCSQNFLHASSGAIRAFEQLNLCLKFASFGVTKQVICCLGASDLSLYEQGVFAGRVCTKVSASPPNNEFLDGRVRKPERRS